MHLFPEPCFASTLTTRRIEIDNYSMTSEFLRSDYFKRFFVSQTVKKIAEPLFWSSERERLQLKIQIMSRKSGNQSILLRSNAFAVPNSPAKI